MRVNAILLSIVLLVFSNAASAVPKIEHWTLPNGARVYFVSTRELPLLQLRVVFDAASGRDPDDKAGLALMTNRLLRHGAGALTADDIANGFENLGAEFGTECERDMAVAELRSLSDPKLLNPALDLFTKILAQPSFPEASLQLERERALVALQREEQMPDAIVEKDFMRRMYANHPYGHEPQGIAKSLRAIKRDDLVAHHQRYYTGANAWLALVGDVSMEEAKKIAQRVLGGLPAGTAAPPIPPPRDIAQPYVREISFPATQSHIRLGQPGIARTDPDYFALYVGNYTLGGGGLVSRLSDEVREKRGFSYSVYSYFVPMRVRGPFVVGLQTKNAQRAEALKVVRQVVADFVSKGPTEKELQAAKKNLTGGFPLRLDSNKKIADQLSVIAFYGLPLNYLNEFVANIEAVTADQIRDAFKRRINPDKLVTVVAGGEG